MLFTAIPSSLTLSGMLAFSFFGAGSSTFAGGLSCARRSEVSHATAVSVRSLRADEPSGSLMAYVLVLQDRHVSMQIDAHTSDSCNLSSLKAAYGKAFLWFRMEHQCYVIRDQATLGKAQDLLKPEEALDHQEEALDKQEAELERRQEVLDAKQEGIDERLEQLDEKEEASEDGDLRANTAVERQSLRKEKAPLEKEVLALEQELKGLSQQQEELGRAQEKASREAERGLHNLMAEAIRSGLAVKVDKAASALKR